MSEKNKSPFEDKWPVKKDTRFLVEVRLTEDHELLGGELLNLFYNTEKMLGHPVPFEFTQIYLKDGFGTVTELKERLREAFEQQLEKMFTTSNYETNELNSLIR
jgi:hypothetical protein